jgi:hypothetical protein
LARALIVGCGCRGLALGLRLRQRDWRVRGTSRHAGRAEALTESGLEGTVADPETVATLLDEIGDVTIVFWLMGTASGETDSVAAIHGPRLERVMEEIVDTPVRGVVYESAGTVSRDVLLGGEQIVRAAAARWRIPVAVVDADPVDVDAWLDAMTAAAERLIGAGRHG